MRNQMLMVGLVSTLLLAGCSNNNGSNNISTPASAEPSPTEMVATASPEVPSEKNPQEILEQYMQAIEKQDTVQLVELYGGAYDGLKNFSTESDADDQYKLFSNYMKSIPEVGALNEILETSQISEDEYKYVVNFKQKDGSLFQTREFDIIHDKFTYTVKKIEGEYKVMELPPYQP